MAGNLSEPGLRKVSHRRRRRRRRSHKRLGRTGRTRRSSVAATAGAAAARRRQKSGGAGGGHPRQRSPPARTPALARLQTRHGQVETPVRRGWWGRAPHEWINQRGAGASAWPPSPRSHVPRLAATSGASRHAKSRHPSGRSANGLAWTASARSNPSGFDDRPAINAAARQGRGHPLAAGVNESLDQRRHRREAPRGPSGPRGCCRLPRPKRRPPAATTLAAWSVSRQRRWRRRSPLQRPPTVASPHSAHWASAQSWIRPTPTLPC